MLECTEPIVRHTGIKIQDELKKRDDFEAKSISAHWDAVIVYRIYCPLLSHVDHNYAKSKDELHTDQT